MSDEVKMEDKAYYYLLHLFDTYKSKSVHTFLSKSELFLRRGGAYSDFFGDVLIIRVDPETYKENQDFIPDLSEIISKKVSEVSGLRIKETKVFPDLDKYQYIHSQLVVITTPWEEINIGQNHLIKNLREADNSQDYQNIGNSSRTILQKLSDIVFDPAKHKCDDPSIDLSPGSFKNRLHTIIKTELAGKRQKEMREFAQSLVSTAEKSIDLTNKLTHDLKASKRMSEISVISVISVIGIIKNIF